MKSITLAFLLFFIAAAGKAQTYYVRISTVKGDITVMLYDETPKHRDNFIKGIRTGLFKDAEFNRVIKAFVSQAGELDNTIEDREKLHPELPVQRIAAEINPKYFHKKGAFGAGRNDNPEKSSFIDQIYLVEGKKQTDEQLDAIETKTGHQYSPAQREMYKTIGGIPRLDGDYTVFGEIVKGIEVAEAINGVQTSSGDHPLIPLKFTLTVLTKKEAAKLLKH